MSLLLPKCDCWLQVWITDLQCCIYVVGIETRRKEDCVHNTATAFLGVP
jgi:hypothetical protein